MKFRAITENHLYDKTFAKGARGVARTVAVYVLRDYKANSLAKANPTKRRFNRIGLSVGKKIGGAVGRNRAKRIIREAYRLLDRELHIPTGNLIVLAARPEIVGVKMGVVKGDMKYCLRKAGLLPQAGQAGAASGGRTSNSPTSNCSASATGARPQSNQTASGNTSNVKK